MSTTSSFMQATKFQVNRIFTTVSSAKNSIKSSLFLSFTQFLKENLISDPSRGTFSNIYPFLTHRISAPTINLKVITDLAKSSTSKVIFSLGHHFPVDPGAVANHSGRIFTETESIIHFMDVLLNKLNLTPKRFSFDILPWNDLRQTIKLLNDIATSRTTNKRSLPVHISIHSDFGVNNVDSRPLTFGVYYGSPEGRALADNLCASFIDYAHINYPNKQFKTWVRHDSQSPHGRLGIVRDISPVSLVLELDFVSRPIDDLNIVYDCAASAFIAQSKLLDV